MSESIFRAFALGFALLAAACTQPAALRDGAPHAVETEQLTIDTAQGPVNITVEIADDDQERARGLMYRPPLPDNYGMLFHFQRPERASFWMQNTPSSLDIIFIGVDGRILNIAAHTIPYSTDGIPSAGLTRGVLEIRAGHAAQLGIQPGDRVRHRIFPS
jgi:uncharacterized membrane protein (UPF0127 family)